MGACFRHTCKSKCTAQLKPMPQEYELLKRTLKTDHRVQTEVYEACSTRVYNSCLRILRDAHEAEDLMHEAFIHAFTRIDSFRGDCALSTWICRIAINKCLDHLKKRRVKLTYLNDWECRPEEPAAAATAHEMPYDVQRILQAMEQLPEGCRLVFNLHLLEEMDHVTIAEKLGIKEASSRAQYARAKNRIKELVNRTYVRP